MKSKNVVCDLIHPALPPASAKGQMHQKSQTDHIAFLSHVPVGKKKKPKHPTRVIFLVCTHRECGCQFFSLLLSQWHVAATRRWQRSENWEIQLHSLWGFVAKLLLKKHHVHTELEVLELAQRTLLLVSKAQKSKEEEVNQRSVPRTISFGSDHRGHCTVSFLSSSFSVGSVLTFTRGVSCVKHSVREVWNIKTFLLNVSLCFSI